jgi:CheY-like chemotaxis protein
VVLADDNADMRDYVRRLLTDRYVVDTVLDGEEALASILAKRPDLVLTDVMMPRLDGLGLLQKIRADPRLRDLPVILLSARAGEEVEGRTAGADDYLTKPFSARELVARIGAALELARVRRQAAGAIRESEARLRALVNATSQMTYRLSPDWTEMRELDGSNILADSQTPRTDWFKDEIHPDDYASVWNDIQEAIRTKSVFDREHRFRLPDGGWGWIHSRAVPLLDADGQIYEWFGAAADVTVRRTAQEELSALNADLERRVDLAASQLVQLQKMESIGQLTGGIAHDFNNLLMAILTSLEIAKGRLHDGRDTRLLMIIDNAIQAAQRGAALTQRMLAFARKQELKPQPVCLHELVMGMADLLTRSIGPQIRIQTSHAFGTPKAMADSNQLEMAILNLAVNARDAMPDGGLLTISSDKVSIVPGGPVEPGQYARLQVTDSGTGMDGETLRRATEPFFTTKGTGKGTGLGLSMVHGLAAQSGGHFELRSAPGRGTTAEILLPVSSGAEEAAIPAVAGQSGSTASGRRLTVLAVDDDPLVLMGLVLVLEDQGHEVIEAYSGRQALELLGNGRADLVITDQAMPGMTGVQLAAAIQSRWPLVPVILATGYGELPDGAAPTHRLRKPFSPEELANVLAEIMGRQDPSLVCQ